jgi:hypothetical protein
MELIRSTNNKYWCFYCNYNTKLKFNLIKHLTNKKHLEKMRFVIFPN